MAPTVPGCCSNTGGPRCPSASSFSRGPRTSAPSSNSSSNSDAASTQGLDDPRSGIQSRRRSSKRAGIHMQTTTRLVPRDRVRAVALFLLAVLPWACSNGAAAPPPPPVTVAVVDVVAQDVPVRTTWVATLDGYVNAKIQPQVTGYLVQQNYVEGSYVQKGDVLFEIDPRPFQAALDQARGQKAQADAQLGRATIDVERDI